MPQQFTPSWNKYPNMSGLWLVECTNDRTDKVDMSVEDFVVRGNTVRCVSYDGTLSDWQEYTFDYSYRYYGPIPNENA
jgi:hypothetical protein